MSTGGGAQGEGEHRVGVGGDTEGQAHEDEHVQEKGEHAGRSTGGGTRVGRDEHGGRNTGDEGLTRT